MSQGRSHHPNVFLIASSLAGLLIGTSGCVRDWDQAADAILHAVMEAEDARGLDPAGLDPILQGINASDPFIQGMAVRGLGRLEDPSQLGVISSLLSSPSPEVRAEAANALGQAVYTVPGDTVGIILRAHLEVESDPVVRGAVGRTLGRLTYGDPGEVQKTETSLMDLTAGGAPLPTLLGAAMGLEWMPRRNRGIQFSELTVSRLEALTSFGLTSSDSDSDSPSKEVGVSEEAARMRRVALMALAGARAASPETIQPSFLDPDPDVRRLAIAAVGRGPSFPGGWPALDGLLADGNPRVRTQALGALGNQAEEDQRCTRLQSAIMDPDTQVAIGAMDLLGQRCPATAARIQELADLIGAPEAATPDQWHRGAHALTALAELSPQQASGFLEGFASHVSLFARAYGARAAAVIGSRTGPETDAQPSYSALAREILVTLTNDPVPNVRTEAVQGLFRLNGHEIDRILLSQLTQNDPQLLQTVAGLLRDTPAPAEAALPLLDAFRRISGEKKETYRDPRMAILARIAEIGDSGMTGDLEPYLSDYDPVIADRVAGLLSEWTGQSILAAPQPIPHAPVPSPAELRELAGSRFFLVMDGGGEIELRLLPFLAPTNSARFARLARAGYFDGLTFHRVVPNFVLQGGSPAANELAGDGPYTRDEIGLQSNWRGTVGISTRGRDTGDGQIFINLVDNLRLDHNYTIFAEVVAGMDVVDKVLEGQVIRSVREIQPG